jgi:hypothetical protein
MANAGPLPPVPSPRGPAARAGQRDEGTRGVTWQPHQGGDATLAVPEDTASTDPGPGHGAVAYAVGSPVASWARGFGSNDAKAAPPPRGSAGRG